MKLIIDGLKIAALFGSFIGAYSSSQACPETAKTVHLQNSPFPFKTFTMNSNSFQYVTADGMTNTLQCQEESSSYSWNIATELKGTVTLYGYADIQAAGAIVADDKEAGDRTPVTISNTVNNAMVRIAKAEGPSAIELSCQVSDQNIMMMAAVMKNKQGTVIGAVEVSKLRGVRGLATVTDQQPSASGTIDFQAQKLQQIRFAGCGK